jgi:hypothetical protein
MGARGTKKVPEFWMSPASSDQQPEIWGFQSPKVRKKIVTNSQIIIFCFQSITKNIESMT